MSVRGVEWSLTDASLSAQHHVSRQVFNLKKSSATTVKLTGAAKRIDHLITLQRSAGIHFDKNLQYLICYLIPGGLLSAGQGTLTQFFRKGLIVSINSSRC